MVSYTVLAYAFMPALAIAVGGWITTYIAWIGCFYFCLIYGIFILAISTRLPETLKVKKYDALKLKPLLASYYHGFSNGRLVLFSSIYGLMVSFIYVITSHSPFIGIDTIGLTATHYGLLLLIPYTGQLIGGIFSGKISRYLSGYQVMGLGYFFTILGSTLMFVWFLYHWINIISLIVPIFLIMLGLPMSYSCVVVMALIDYDDKATGSSIMSFITMFISLIATFIITILPNHQPIVMPSLFIVILILAILSFYYAYCQYSE